jgi:peptidoglycan/xylan/chitin deacetylase (PgdA/CDA1 family)
MQATVGQVVKSGVAWAGWRIPSPTVGNPVILLYHGTPRKSPAGRLDESSFARQIQFLKRHFELIAPSDFGAQRSGGRTRVLLTFDDGFRNNFEVARPILCEHDAPAMFFVSSRHSQPGKYLWFAYLRALEDFYPEPAVTFRGSTFSLRGEARRPSIERLKNILLTLRPHPTAMYEAIENELPALEDWMTPEQINDSCAGMDAGQVCDLAQDPLFTVGGHTTDHPFLGRCTEVEMRRQIDENKSWLERASGHTITEFAYPSGDYDSSVISACKEFGFGRGYAVIPAARPAGSYELGRIGVYSTSLDVVGFLVRWGSVLRALRVPMG